MIDIIRNGSGCSFKIPIDFLKIEKKRFKEKWKKKKSSIYINQYKTHKFFNCIFNNNNNNNNNF